MEVVRVVPHYQSLFCFPENNVILILSHKKLVAPIGIYGRRLTLATTIILYLPKPVRAQLLFPVHSGSSGAKTAVPVHSGSSGAKTAVPAHSGSTGAKTCQGTAALSRA